MKSARSQILAWIRDGTIPPGDIGQALAAARIEPDRAQWRRFIDRLLLVLGTLSLVCAAVFFVATNWDLLGRFARFALFESLMIAAVVLYWWLGPGRLAARLALLVAGILLGTVLVLYSQAYQTGADDWRLYAAWALLLLPWAVVGRFALLWLLWLTVLNLAAVFYYQALLGVVWTVFDGGAQLFWLLFILNTAAWLGWEWLGRRFTWLSAARLGRWPVRLIASASGVSLTLLVLYGIFDPGVPELPPWLVLLAWLALLYFAYRRRLPDLFMLAGGLMALIVCITSLFIDRLLGPGEIAGSFLLLSLLVVGQAALAAWWLRQVHREQVK